jgi:hydroxypyruvate isomerase
MDCVAPITRRRFARWAAAGLTGVAVGSRDGWRMPDTAKRPFKLSVMLWTLRPKYTAEQAIELVAGAGYNGFELVDEDKKWSDADVTRIRSRMKQLGIVCDAMSGIATGFAEAGAAERLGDELTARMTGAERMGCRRIILLSGKRDNATPREKQHAVCVANLQRAGELAAKRGFDLLIEPIDALENPSIYLTHVEEAFDIARAANLSSVQVLYDFYHEAKGDGLLDVTSSLLSPLKGNIDLLGLVHVANVPGRHTPLTGEIRYPDVYAALRKEGYDGWLAMEFLPVGDAKAELQQAAAKVL